MNIKLIAVHSVSVKHNGKKLSLKKKVDIFICHLFNS